MVPEFKIAFVKAGEPKTLYSRMFDDEGEAREFSAAMRSKGYNTLLMRAQQVPQQSDDVQFYAWKLLNDGASDRYRLGLFLTSPKFVVPAVLALFAFLLLKRNGLPRVIG